MAWVSKYDLRRDYGRNDMAKAPAPKDEPPDPKSSETQSQPTAVAGPVPPRHQQSFGEKAVGLDFNPSSDPDVTSIKRLYAQIIDLCHEKREEGNRGRITAAPQQHESARLWSIAITEAQGAQMWAVKAATWRE